MIRAKIYHTYTKKPYKKGLRSPRKLHEKTQRKRKSFQKARRVYKTIPTCFQIKTIKNEELLKK